MAKTATARAGVIQNIVAEVHSFCVAKANPALVQKYSRYFTEGYDAFGVDSKDPEWAIHRDDWIARLRAAGPTACLDAGDILTATGKYEETSFALLFAAAIRDRYTPETFARIGTWFDGNIRNWGHTDVFSSMVLAPFLEDGVIDLDTLAAWRTSEFKFKRRAVPVTLIPLLKKRTDFSPLFAVIEPLMTDSERVVHQGCGWFLREAWKLQPAVTEKFLMRYKEVAPRLMIQYATEKMTAAGRARFRRTVAKKK